MRKLQDSYYKKKFTSVADAIADKNNVITPLGYLIVLDLVIQSFKVECDAEDSFDAIRQAVNDAGSTNITVIGEKLWFKRYLEVVSKTSAPNTRLVELTKLATVGNWDLVLPIVVRGITIYDDKSTLIDETPPQVVVKTPGPIKSSALIIPPPLPAPEPVVPPPPLVITPPPPPKPILAPPPSSQTKLILGRDLEFGMKGEDVLMVQTALKKLKYPVYATGDFDRQTAKIVRQFQRLRGLPINGIIDIAMKTELGLI